MLEKKIKPRSAKREKDYYLLNTTEHLLFMKQLAAQQATNGKRFVE